MIKITNKELNKLQMQKKAPAPKPKPAPVVDPNIAATKDLAEAIKSISIQQTEKLDLSPFIIALTSVQETQLKLIDSMKIKPKKEEWEFAVTRNKKGEIEKVFARNV